MADEPSLNFKFSLDLSDFDKAPKIIDDALRHIASQAEAQGKNADLAMSKWVQDMIKERESRVAELTKQIEDATRAYAETFANFQNGNATYEDWEKSYEALNKLKDELSQTKDELNLLNEKEKEVAGNASFLTQLKMKAQGMDLYGKSMSMLPAPIANVIKANGKLDASLKKLLANPIVLTIAAVVMAIKLLGDAVKGVFNYFDGLADRNETVAYWFGVITGAVEKIVDAFNELINLNWDGFVYNLKTMFDGGEREIASRNEDLRRVEEQGLRDRLNRDNQFLRRRMNNTKLDMKDRLDAEKQYTANLRTIEETRRAELERKMTKWSKKNGLRTKDNPEGWATDISQLAGPLQVELQEMYNEMARIDNAMADITEESKDRLVKMRDQVHSEFEANQRQVYESLQAEKERLREMAIQNDNAVIQAQINDMADGIEKVSRQARQKAIESMEALDKELLDEAKKLYNNEKAIFEGDPANEGKMFKKFNMDDYVRQARQNIGYGIREELISNEEVSTVKKAVDDMTKKALENAKKVSEQVKESVDKLKGLSNADLPAVFGGEISLGFKEYVRDLEKVDGLAENARRISEELIDLERERLMLEIQLNTAQTNDEKLAISEKMAKNTEATNIALKKAKINEEALKQATDDVKKSYDNMMSTIQQISGGIGECANKFKGLSKEGDEFIEALQQMLSIVGKLASGDYIGAIVQVIVLAVQTTVNVIKSIKEHERLFEEWKQKMTNIYDSVAGAVYVYKQALIDAKFAEEELWSGTTINRMQKMIEKSKEAKDRLEDLQGLAWEQRKIEGVYERSDLYYQMLNNGVVARNGQKIKGTGLGLKSYDMYGSYYATLETGYQDFWHRGNLLKDVLASRNMEQIFNEYGDFNLEAYKALKKKATDAWEGLAEIDRKQLDEIAEVAEEYEKYNAEMQEEMASWYSPLLDNMTDAWMNWLETGENVMDRFKEYSSDTFRDILKDVLQKKLFDTAFSEFSENISTLTENYLDTGNDDEYAKKVAESTQEMMDKVEENSDIYEKVMNAYSEALKEKGIDILGETSGRNAEARGIARASQESVDENNARLAMMQQHTYSINANVAQLVSYSASALEHLSAIHSNTNRLERIEGLLSDINTYGVRTR